MGQLEQGRKIIQIEPSRSEIIFRGKAIHYIYHTQRIYEKSFLKRSTMKISLKGLFGRISNPKG